MLEPHAVVIPALNEALRIREVVEQTLRHCPWVIVVDDGSEDGTAQCLQDLPVTVLRHPYRRGKGAALRTGFAEAHARGAYGVITLDGDGQHDPSDLPRLLAAAARHPDRIVIGARLRHRAAAPTHRRLANAFGDWGVAWAAGHRIADTQSGQRYYPAAVLALEDVPGEDFVFEAQLLISAARRLGVRCVSIPVETRYRGADYPMRRSHFRPLHDLYRITSHVVRQVVAHGDVWNEYRRVRAQAPVIDAEA
ncbi:dolichyl-phosphate mannose synthase [Pseudoxanthomonas broegbernensis]|uniref:Dolichyl-phosphate mannose synthase n=1 Tax=Pseudoxanthomonas broegbernensis TaxID=83619 RepID=A0A7V8GLD5_9GAMM|nr:glycosyltransferase family 2 protein [Pseudoxanthomonas broegbernensis]KAF1685722.1 dolichyl-phosphate mannose synthase [Pseudoxanthomonas broegbernensis]MBB6066071.1 glycosyltransferase involved in cell wall biosynthesis [Pseudoxanthomonas broegbernensis]